MFKTKCCCLLKSFDHRKYLECRKKVYNFKKKHNFSSPSKLLGVRVETNIPKNSKAIIMLALCPGRLEGVNCITRVLKMTDKIFHITAGNVKFVVSQWPNPHPFKLFCTKRDYITGTQFWKYCTVGWKKLLEATECWSIKSIWFRAELNFCPKTLLAGRNVLLKKRCGNAVSTPNIKGRLIGLQEFPHWVFLFHFSATVLYTRKNCHLFIYAAPGATRRNWN